jgi:hypothetical protein
MKLSGPSPARMAEIISDQNTTILRLRAELAAARDAGREDVLALLSAGLANDLRNELKGPRHD